MKIKFHSIEVALLISYYYFTNQVSNRDLLELNSFKIRNVLSIAFNSEIKNLILEDLFSKGGNLLTSETKDNLYRYLSLEERDELKQLLSDYLEYQINSDWFESLTQELHSEAINTVLIPSVILNHDLILNQLNSLFPKKKFVAWISFNESSKTLILDYNHGWKKTNIFTIQNSNSTAIFLKHFFENIFQWKKYNADRHLFNRMNTQTRELIIGKKILSEIKDKLTSLRPKNSLNEWDILHEREHKSQLNPSEEIIIHFSPNTSNRYRISSSFLLEKDKRFSFKEGKDLTSNTAPFENKFNISNLENIITQIDLIEFNKAIEKDSSCARISESLSGQLNLNEDNGEFWKQLLELKVREHGMNHVFVEIEEISGIKKFVSLNTFKNTYCNPLSSSIIPREKKVFKAICHYLELPLEYRACMHRKRNLIGGHSQELNSKLKELIKVIINYNILNKCENDDELLEIISLSIDEIEKRVDMDFFGFTTKDSLIYGCIQLCYEIIDKMKLKPILKIEHNIPN